MSPVLEVVTMSLAAVMGLSLYRVLAGPTIFDRLTGVSLIGTKSIILLLLLGLLYGKLDATVDVALSYSLITLLSTLMLAKYVEHTETR